eukprot:12302315-Alexandrium_andersonii.AAC.1
MPGGRVGVLLVQGDWVAVTGGHSLVVDDVLVEGTISSLMANAYVDPGRKFAMEMGCEITSDCDISSLISSAYISSAQVGNAGPRNGLTPGDGYPSERGNDVDRLMSIAQSVVLMKEDLAHVAPLASHMSPALTVAVLAHGDSLPMVARD